MAAHDSAARAGVLLILVLALLLCSCDGGRQAYRFTRFAMGTVIEYVVIANDRDDARRAVDQAHTELERVSRLLWEGNPASEISRLNASCEIGDGSSCDSLQLSDETLRFLERSLDYLEESDGSFDITVGSFLSLYRFSPDSARVPRAGQLDTLIGKLGTRKLAVDWNRISGLRAGVRISVGGVAKGYAVDRAVATLKEAGVSGALVNAGGDLYCLGSNDGTPWRVGIRHPDEPESVIAVLHVTDAAVATSGDYQQFVDVDGVRYHHILDPDNGRPARRARSATVIAVSAERADALATGLFVDGPNGLGFVERARETEGLVLDSLLKQHETTGLARLRSSD
jgi:thiamine biosynthesis lipoprotein